MAKVMIFLKRREDLDREAFAAWWLGPHRALVARLEGLRRMTFNQLPAGAPYDAVVEQWFDSVEAAECCYDTDLGRSVAADSQAHVSARARLLVDEHAFAADDHVGR